MPHRTLLDLLAGRPVRGVSGSFTIASVCHRLRDYRIGALVVVEAKRLVGIITERDIATRVIAGHRDPMLTLVREVMTRDPQTIAAEASLAEAHRLMIAGGFRHLPVMRGDDVIGMVSLRDLPAAGDSSLRDTIRVPALG
ncbi:CBS domain-containing protein [Methylobacterium aquaticum]|uniref:Signal transduction protein n=1 Tax=Methylobacterium aquaticum TaxID=270351 RepID=A0A0J6T4J0_9HYPH|nr:CBS domain-containing protein [Methylobacterium aquaticum]KMO40707.1 signal transduction protein [Methylobacterium aquaticum]